MIPLDSPGLRDGSHWRAEWTLPLVDVGAPSTDSAGIVGASAEGAHFGTLTLLARWVYPQETEL
jgi:hypothetical protein